MWLEFEGVWPCSGLMEWHFREEEWGFGCFPESGVLGWEEPGVGGVESEFGGVESECGREWKVATFEGAYQQVQARE